MWLTRVLVIIVLLFSIENNNVDGLKILGLFPLPGKSHFSTGEELFKILADRGHQLDVVSHFPQKKLYPNYNDISLDGSLPMTLNNITFNETKQARGFAFRQFIEKTGLETCDLLGHPRVQELIKKPKGSYDVIIVEVGQADNKKLKNLLESLHIHINFKKIINLSVNFFLLIFSFRFLPSIVT